MASRQSLVKLSAALSRRSRSTIASRSAISPLVHVWAVIQSRRFQSAKLISITEHEDMRFAQHARHEMVTAADFVGELLRRIHSGVHFASELGLRRLNRADDLVETRIADDHQIDVAVVPQLVPGGRAEDKRGVDALRQRLQRGPEHVSSPAVFTNSDCSSGNTGDDRSA